jgi:hypothetical protein
MDPVTDLLIKSVGSKTGKHNLLIHGQRLHDAFDVKVGI